MHEHDPALILAILTILLKRLPELTYYEQRVEAIQALLIEKGTDERG